MPLARVRLELGRVEGYPNGSSQHGYEFVAPLTKDGHIDPSEWSAHKERGRVRRFWGPEPEENRMLKRHGQHGWYFDYPAHPAEEDEPFFKLERHNLAEGAYVSITEHDGVQRPFKVAEVTPIV